MIGYRSCLPDQLVHSLKGSYTISLLVNIYAMSRSRRSAINHYTKPDSKVYAKKFSGKYSHRLITGGVGHNLPQEAPKDFVNAIIEVAGYAN